MKKISKLVVALLIFAVAAVAMVACKPNASGVTEIRVDSSNMPLRTTFVQGQDLDLFGGYLTVVKDGEEELISLDDPSLEISGYDKNTVGRQQLTIKYGEKETTLTVNVSKRITVKLDLNANPDGLKFFQGMEFTLPAAMIYVTDDFGKAGEEVSIGEPDVIVNVPNDFSATPGKKEIGITFGGYTDTFEVEVYEIANRNFTGPNHRAYKSHDTQMDLKGGFILYQDAKAANNMAGGFQKYVDLTQDMIVEGTFNPAAATYENNYKGIEGNTDLSQDVKFSYGGFEYKFNIQIEFSDISLAKYYSGVLADEVDWNDAETEITQTQYDMAVKSAEIYFGLNDDERALFTTESLKPIMTVASYYLYNMWLEGISNYDDAIVVSYDPSTETTGANYVGSTYAEATASLARLKEPGFAQISAYNTILSNILSTFATFEFVEGVTIADYCEFSVYQSSIDFIVGGLEFAIQFHDTLDGVTINDVRNFYNVTEDVQEQINDCIEMLLSSYYIGYRPLFASVEAWHPGFFDILYQYHYDMAIAFLQNNPSLTEWNSQDGLYVLFYLGYGAYLPEPLELFYTYSEYIYQEYMMAAAQQGVVDASAFYYYYDGFLKALDTIEKSSNPLYRNLLNVMQFATPYYTETNENNQAIPIPVYAEQMILDADLFSINAYESGVYGLEEYDALIAEYLPLVELYLSGTYMVPDYELGEYVLSEAFCREVPKFFESFLTYTSGIQTMFLMNVSATDGIFDVEVPNYTTISLVLELYYSNALDADTYAVFSDLIVAVESFLKRDYSETYDLDNFASKFNAAKTAYNKLDSDQQAQISFLYDHVNGLMGLLNSRTLEFNNITISNSTWNTKFNNMAKMMGGYYFLYINMQNYGIYGAFLEYAAKMELEYANFVAEINAVQDAALKAELIKALQFKTINILSEYNSTYDISLEDCYLNLFRPTYTSLIGSGYAFNNSVSLMYYWDDAMVEKFASTAEVSLAMFRVLMGFGSATEIINRNDFDAIFKSFLSRNGWTLEQKVIFSEIHWMNAEYFGGSLFMQAFWGYYSVKTGIDQSEMGDDAIITFISLVDYYNEYSFYLSMNAASSELATAYQNALNMFNTAYNKLSDTQKAAFDAEFGSYVNIYKTAPRG